MELQCSYQVLVEVWIGENWENIFKENAFGGEIWELAERLLEPYLKTGEFGGLQALSEPGNYRGRISCGSWLLTAVGGVGGSRSRSWEAVAASGSDCCLAGSISGGNGVFMMEERKEDEQITMGLKL